jgi:hypothetical protein
MYRHIRNWLASLTLPFALGLPQAHAYTHPCIPLNLDDLATLKASLNQNPWKDGYKKLSSSAQSQLTYTMKGPFTTVTRNPDLNLGQWKGDMQAVYNLALMWYMTGDTAYAQKSHDILLAWANTQTSFGGHEIDLSIGDYAGAYAGGADILRGTWPGWTDADTTTVKNYFLNLHWPASIAGFNTIGPANKGDIYMAAGIAIAAFCDDTVKFNHVINNFRTLPASGLTNTLPTGELGETGRDQGHSFGSLAAMAFIAEVAWKQGIDLYSELDNRILACGEYYARNTLMTDNPFVTFGSIDYCYYVNNGDVGTYTAGCGPLYLIQNAYKNRKGLPTPWIDLKLQSQPVDFGTSAKTADFTTATPLSPIVRPAVSVASSGLTLISLGETGSANSLSYTNGVWTLAGSGWGVWGGAGTNDSCQFAYKTITGDCAMVAKVNPFPYTGNTAGRMGLMIRDNLVKAKSQTAIVSLSPHSTGSGYYFESNQVGWTDNWGGSNWASRKQTLPLPMPYWLKIERIGNHINTYTSPDGATWAPNTSSYHGNGLPSAVNIGLFLCTGGTMNATGTYSNLAFTGGSGGLVTTPEAPAAVFASGSSKVITVRWVPSFGATSYNLLRSTTSGSGYAAIASNLSTATTSYVDTTASAGTTYYYVVQAVNSAGTSGNSPQFYGSRLTAPLVNLAFSAGGTASSNDGSSGWDGPAQAFDNDPWTRWYNGNTQPGPTGWLRYDFGSGIAPVIKRYTVNSADVTTRNPKDWTFQGSNDGSTWTTLDTQSGQTFSDPYKQNIYNIANTTGYRHYQLNVTAGNGGALGISELGLWSDTGRTLQDGTYRIVNKKSNKVLTALNGGTANGTGLVQWSWGGGNEQKWTLTHQGNGQYKVTGLASGRVMDVSGVSTANGALLHLWDWFNANNQKWTVTPAGDGFFKLTAVHSGKAADVSGGSTADGANILQWTYGGSDNQQWRISIAP